VSKPRRGPGRPSDRAPARGVVLRDEGSQLVVDVDGEEIPCVVRKSLRRRSAERKAVAVGDRVTVEWSGEGAVITEVAPRTSSLSRPDPSQRRREQVLVANVDTVLLVASARDPDLAPGLLDRFLVAVESRELEVALVVNKVDLDPDCAYETVVSVYRDLGYRVLPTSATMGLGLEAVRGFLSGRTTTLLGHSGVGKSSLANALDPTLQLRTGDVRTGSGRGMHTTTTVSLLRLPWGGYLVDTPGIREFGLWGLAPADAGFWFREIARHAPECRFNDCLHEHEPGCAVQREVALGNIVAWRYESYLRILASLREHDSA